MKPNEKKQFTLKWWSSQHNIHIWVKQHTKYSTTNKMCEDNIYIFDININGKRKRERERVI